MTEKLRSFFAGKTFLYILVCLSLLVGIFGTVAGSLALFGRSAPDSEEMTPGALYDAVLPSVVSVLCYYEGESTLGESGTGFFLNEEGLIATAYHVVHGVSRVTVRTSDKKEYTDVRIVGYDKDLDVVLLKIERDGCLPVKTASTSPTSGDRVYAIGRYLGADFTFTESMISTVGDRMGRYPKRTLIRYCNLAQIGSSGGPVFNNKGEIIGMCQIQDPTDGSLQWALEISHVDTVKADLFLTPAELAAQEKAK